MRAKRKVQKRQRLVLAIVHVDYERREEKVRFFVSPSTTLGEIGELETLLNKMAAPARFELVPHWEDVP